MLLRLNNVYKICLYFPLSVQPTILFTVSYACAILLSFNMYLVQVVTLSKTKVIAVASYFMK